MPAYPAPANAFSYTGSEGSSEQRHPTDTQQNWVHGYFQEIPAYGGHHLFRPYNYKDVLSQSQTAAGWGERPGMPYSQQFWHKYHDQATMIKTTQAAPMRGAPVWQQPATVGRATPGQGGWSIAPGSRIVTPQYGGPQYSAPQFSGPVYSAPQYSAPQFPAQQYSAPQYSAPISSGPLHMPPQNMATPVVFPEETPGSGIQNAVEYVNPAGYRR
jgi:hypothetical protein